MFTFRSHPILFSGFMPSLRPAAGSLGSLVAHGVLGKLQAWLKLVRERDPGYGLPTPCTCRLLIFPPARSRLARQLSLLSCKHQHWVSLSLVRLTRLREKFGFQEVIYKFRKKQGNPWKNFGTGKITVELRKILNRRVSLRDVIM